MHAIDERNKPIDSCQRDLSHLRLHEVDWEGRSGVVGKSYQCFGRDKDLRAPTLVPTKHRC